MKHQDDFLMQWTNEKVHYQNAIESETLPEVTLTIPHDRIRTLIINDEGLLSTENGSSYFYFVRSDWKDADTLIKLYDNSCNSILDEVFPKHFLKAAETTR